MIAGINRDPLVRALLLSQLIRHGDSIRGAYWWPKTRAGHEAAIAEAIGSKRVMVPRLRFSSVKPKQSGEQAASGRGQVHRFSPGGSSRHSTPDPILPPRESLAVFPLTGRRS